MANDASNARAESFIQRVLSWIAANVVPPTWLPQGWRNGWVLFTLSGALQVLATLLTAMILQISPDFSFRGALFVVGASLSARLFGGTLGVFASVVGSLLLKFFFLPPVNTLRLDKFNDTLVTGFYLGVCLAVAFCARPLPFSSEARG
jgi:K+-sensing histidine kinase KdpD